MPAGVRYGVIATARYASAHLVSGRSTRSARAVRRRQDAALARAGAGGPAEEISVTPVEFMSEGTPVQAVLYRRRELRDRVPALVVSTGAGRNLTGLEWLSLPLARRGYVVLTQRFRESGTRFHPRDDEDIANGISYLERLPDVDARRVGIAGRSRGGAAVLRTAAKDARVRSTAALCGPTDYERWTRGIQHYSPRSYASAIKRYGVAPDDDPEYYRVISPISYAGQIKTPVLIVQGASDLQTPPDHAEWMYDALVAAGNQRVKLEMLPGLGHAFEDGTGYGFDTVVRLVSRWFADTL